MRQPGGDDTLELLHEAMHPIGWEIESKEFNGHEPLTVGLVCAKHRSQCSRADLVKDTKSTERVWWREPGNFGVQ